MVTPAAGLYPWLRQLYGNFSQQQQWHHAILFRTGKGLGVEQLVARLVELRHCSAPIASAAGSKGCGQCQHCLLHVSGTHPDYISIAPLAGKAQISIDQIRHCNAQLLKKGLLSQYRLVQIANAHLMTVSAANALLKMLEEPPQGVHFFLSTDQPAQLPATIMSRCSQQTVDTPKVDQTLGWLNRQLEQPVSLAQLHLLDGSPLQALAIAQRNAIEPLQHIVEQYAVALASAGTTLAPQQCLSFIEYLRQHTSEIEIETVLNLIQRVHRDALKMQLQVTQSSSLGLNADTCAHLVKLPSTMIMVLESAICELKQQLILNNGVNVLLQLQQVIVNSIKNA